MDVRRALTSPWAVTAVAGALAAAVQQPLWAGNALLAAVNTVLAAGFALLGIVRYRKFQRRIDEQSRALAASWAERRELEQLLHDGAQTRLSALTMRLGAARNSSDERSGRVLADAQAQLDLALNELRELAHGIHSAMLTESGLGAALESRASRQGVPMRVAVPAERFDPAAEALAYYVVCWVLTDYLQTTDEVVDVNATVTGAELHLRVSARSAPRPDVAVLLGSPIALRVRAAGGTVSIAESPSGRARVEVRIPCR
ncbi:sensor histidine kinase [Cryptosporangium arvum]|uniref:sensor histidine kinase n=1 Tax=Cryptosporangium arvum TaxID=80871 RepID=UPI0004B1FC23|nr:histidine kinase [Cryptosporangium arvum]